MINNEIAPICLLTACKRRKFKLCGDSSQVRAIDNGITCRYWSACLSNRLRAFKAHSSLFKCCENLPKLYVLDTWKTSWFLSLGISWIICVIEIVFIVPFNFNLCLYIFSIRGGGGGGVPLVGNSLRAEKSHWQVQKVTLPGPKSHTRAKMSHWSVIIDH